MSRYLRPSANERGIGPANRNPGEEAIALVDFCSAAIIASRGGRQAQG